jgi:hypothetical protein
MQVKDFVLTKKSCAQIQKGRHEIRLIRVIRVPLPLTE